MSPMPPTSRQKDGEEKKRPSAYDKALALLARRAHFGRELERKLAARGYPAQEAQEALARLRSEGWVDDEKAAADFIDSRLRRGGVGARRLRADLAGRGASAATTNEALKDITRDDELAQARAAADRWLRSHSLRDDRDRGSLSRFLQRRGFPSAVIFRVLDRSSADANDATGDDTADDGT
jgi:regulatory protein